MFIESVMPSSHLILCWLLLLLLSVFPSIRSFPMSLHFASGGQSIGASASASVLPMNSQCWFPLGSTGLISLQSKGLSTVFSNTTVWKHQFFGAQNFLWSNSHIHWTIYQLPRWLRQWRIHLQCGRPGFDPSVGKIPWRRRIPIPVSWSREFHGLYSPWGSQRVSHDWATFTYTIILHHML